MTRLTLPFTAVALLLTGCKNAEQQTGGSSSRTASPSPAKLSRDAQRAQTRINQINQGRACTTLTKKQLETVIDARNPEFAKRQVLIKHGVVKMQKASGGNGTLDWQIYENVPLKEADGKGVFIEDGSITYYCFGRWQVKDAAQSDKVAVPDGKQLLIAQVELVDAVPWIKEDPAAKALAEASISGDSAFMPTLNEFDKVVAPSFTQVNQVALVVPKE
ncbi:hypothetical protein [Deinococcus sp. PESE-13]